MPAGPPDKLSISSNPGSAVSSFTVDALLRLSDAARRSMASAGRLDGLDASLLERLAIFTRAALLDERCGMPSIKFVTVKNARLDKLLAQILDLAKHKNASPTALDIIAQANELQLEWYRRFNVDYFSINKTRMEELEDCGAKREVIFIPPTESGMRVPTSWRPCEDGVSRDIEGSGFQVGQYVCHFSFSLWLNVMS